MHMTKNTLMHSKLSVFPNSNIVCRVTSLRVLKFNTQRWLSHLCENREFVSWKRKGENLCQYIVLWLHDASDFKSCSAIWHSFDELIHVRHNVSELKLHWFCYFGCFAHAGLFLLVSLQLVTGFLIDMA